jgi:hemin uptake protein HemP
MQSQKELSPAPSSESPELSERLRPLCRVLKSGELLGPDGRLLIEHDGQIYSLQRTKAGKLILTK